MSQHVITATNRGTMTKGELHQNRLSGRIPAVAYGSGKPARSIFIDRSQFMGALVGITESTIIDLVVDGETVKAFVKARQRSGLKNEISHVDFLEITAGQSIHARVPIILTGSAVGIREGGILENPCHEIDVVCDPSVLPERIVIDVSGLHVNHSVHIRDIVVNEGVRILTSPDLVIVAIKYARGEHTEEAATTETVAVPAAVPATPAAGAEKKTEKK